MMELNIAFEHCRARVLDGMLERPEHHCSGVNLADCRSGSEIRDRHEYLRGIVLRSPFWFSEKIV